jgi:hypothetical protein
MMAMKEMKSQSYLNKKYEIIEKGTSHVMEMLKQKIKALAEKVRRYTNRSEQYRQNKLSREDEGRFYRERQQPVISFPTRSGRSTPVLAEYLGYTTCSQ